MQLQGEIERAESDEFHMQRTYNVTNSLQTVVVHWVYLSISRETYELELRHDYPDAGCKRWEIVKKYLLIAILQMGGCRGLDARG